MGGVYRRQLLTLPYCFNLKPIQYEQGRRRKSLAMDAREGRKRSDGFTYEAWQSVFTKDIEVLSVVLQVCAYCDYVFPRIRNMGFRTAHKGNVRALRGELALLPFYLFYALHLADGNYLGKQILLPLLAL